MNHTYVSYIMQINGCNIIQIQILHYSDMFLSRRLMVGPKDSLPKRFAIAMNRFCFIPNKTFVDNNILFKSRICTKTYLDVWNLRKAVQPVTNVDPKQVCEATPAHRSIYV
jgi:hypothetical protein